MKKQYHLIANGLLLIALLASACQASPVIENPTLEAEPTPYPSATAGPSPTPAPLREPAWTFETQGEVWSSPTVQDGVVYFGSDDRFLYAVDIATHQLLWKFETGDRVRSRPAVVDGMVYFTSDDNNLYALDSQTGGEGWRFDLGSAVVPISRTNLVGRVDYAISSPVISEGVIYVGSANDWFYAVDASTGQEKWSFKVKWGPVRSTPAVSNGMVYFGDSLDMIYAVDLETGQEIWEFDTHTDMMLVASPTVVDGVLYMGTRGFDPVLFALDAGNGQEKWRLSFGVSWVDSSAVVVDGVIYIGSSDWLKLSAIDAATGQLKWQFTGSGYMWSTPAVDDGMIFIGDTSRYFYAVDAGSGQEQWRVLVGDALESFERIQFQGGVVSSPAVSNDVVYFGGLDGKLYAVSTLP